MRIVKSVRNDYCKSTITGSSQTSKWSAFVLSFNESEQPILWDPEIGEWYNLDDSRCPLMKVSRLINHENVNEELSGVFIGSSL